MSHLRDNIAESGTYFAFKRPIGFLGFIITLFRLPVESFSIVQDSKWYKFSRAYKGLYTSHISAADLNQYVFESVPSVDGDILKALVGTPWKIKSSNCITVFRPVLLSMGIRLKSFDFIPAIFAYKFFTGKYDV